MRLKTADINSFELPKNDAVIVTNPPYGERMLELKQAREIYKTMGEKFTPPGRYYVISPDEEFEEFFGKKAKNAENCITECFAVNTICFIRFKAFY